MNLLRTIAKCIPVFVIVLIVAQIIWSNTLVGSGREVLAIDAAISELRQANDQLGEQVASASSLITVAARSKELGLVEPTKGQFVMIGGSELPVALAR